MKKDVNYAVISLIGILILIAILLMSPFTEKRPEELEVKESLVSKQAQIEEDFEIKGYTLNNPNVILNPYGNSPLTALILFETDEKGLPEVVIKGKDELTTIYGEGSFGNKHYVPVYGLYPGQENEVLIKFNGDEKAVTIKTENLPEGFHLPVEVITPDKSKLTNELYFFTPSSTGYTAAYDVNGDVRWYLTDNVSWDISRLNNGRLLLGTERPLSPPYYTTGLYEMDLLGKVYVEYSLPGGYHHDFFELNNGNLLIASDDFSNYEQGTVEDIVVELDRNTGEIVKEWDLKNVLPMEDGKGQAWTPYDWFHNNSVWYDEEENSIILSGRHQDAVVSIDYDTGDLNWILGDPTSWSEEYQEYFFTPIGDEFEWQWSQHSAKITPEGHVFLLDNGNNKSKNKADYVPAEESYTRGVMYDIDTDEMTIEQVWQYGKERGYEFYSPYISDVDYIDKDHYIVHSGGIVYVDGKISNEPAGFSSNPELYSTTVELIDDEVVFEMTLPTNMYRAEKMSLYDKRAEFKLGAADRLGSLGETIPTKKSGKTFMSTSKKDKEYESYNITFTNEEDRIVMNGTFDKGQVVTVILADKEGVLEYETVVSGRPYTALCINLFDVKEADTTLELNKYINKEGLKGKKEILLKIGDKLYNTEHLIDF